MESVSHSRYCKGHAIFANQTIEAVLALARLRNFRAAAEALGVSTPTLTRLIQRAEADSGIRIFERTAAGAFLTAQGREVAARCAEFKTAMASFERQIGGIAAPLGGELSIACGPLTTRALIQPTVLALLQTRPQVHIRIDVRATVDPLAALMERRIDVFVGDLTHTPGFDGLEIKVLKRHEVVIFARPDHPAHRSGPRSLGSLLEYPFALPYLHRHFRSMLQRAALAEADRRPDDRRVPQIECDDYALLSSLACTARMLTAGTRENFADEAATGRLQEVALTEPLHWNICAAKLRSADFPTLMDFWGLLAGNGTE